MHTGEQREGPALPPSPPHLPTSRQQGPLLPIHIRGSEMGLEPASEGGRGMPGHSAPCHPFLEGPPLGFVEGSPGSSATMRWMHWLLCSPPGASRLGWEAGTPPRVGG